MPKTLQYVLRCYRALLWLYPPDLRRTYGNDIAGVFGQLLCAECAEWKSRGMMITASPSLVITSGVLGTLVGVMMSRHCR
ncbi:hypothetical protein SBA3_190004 [Candidatus Sulfopaludibacter sp. SbA3]|nr:hypothetical protein SBA3_190004 [Candidatus Sulfopaludibacter sp. SbA3]